jgi:hypothetical protein
LNPSACILPSIPGSILSTLCRERLITDSCHGADARLIRKATADQNCLPAGRNLRRSLAVQSQARESIEMYLLHLLGLGSMLSVQGNHVPMFGSPKKPSENKDCPWVGPRHQLCKDEGYAQGKDSSLAAARPDSRNTRGSRPEIPPSPENRFHSVQHHQRVQWAGHGHHSEWWRSLPPIIDQPGRGSVSASPW